MPECSAYSNCNRQSDAIENTNEAPLEAFAGLVDLPVVIDGYPVSSGLAVGGAGWSLAAQNNRKSRNDPCALGGQRTKAGFDRRKSKRAGR